MLNFETLLLTFVLFLQLAGLVEPNDMQCYVADDGNYTHSLVFDYPSISQVRGYVIFDL
jgi:hypothetical protein